MISIVKELLREAIQPSGALNEKELRTVRLIGGAAVLVFLFFVWTAFSFLLPREILNMLSMARFYYKVLLSKRVKLNFALLIKRAAWTYLSK